MKVEPCDLTGLVITPENEWENAYLKTLFCSLSKKNLDLRYEEYENDTFTSLIIMKKEVGDQIL
ncbi:MAG: hypothetical protein AABY22_08370 [Nanoarchaeota archaeon]